MGRSVFGIMFQCSQILSCLLLIGWVTTAMAESKTHLGSLRKAHLPGRERDPFVKTLQAPRHKRSEGSPPCPVTEEMAQDDMMPIYYTPEELDTCLSLPVFEKYLGTLSSYPFTDEHLPVIKKKLDATGYPESVLRNLGDFASLMGPDDIKKWTITSPDTLTSLLARDPSPELATAIIRQYTNSGGPLNADALKAIGTKYICLLDSDQLKKIADNAITSEAPLDPSGCNQTTKDILYQKAKRAFSDRHNPPQYYNLIKPYLEGAPGDDLKALSKDNVNMDMDTFMKLRKDAIMALKPSEVAGLLGQNLKDFKAQKDNPPVKNWIPRQKQSELDKFGFGVQGGTPEGYINITPRNNRPPEMSRASRSLPLHLFPSLVLALSLAVFLS